MEMRSSRTQIPLGIRKTCMPQDSICFWKSLSSWTKRWITSELEVRHWLLFQSDYVFVALQQGMSQGMHLSRPSHPASRLTEIATFPKVESKLENSTFLKAKLFWRRRGTWSSVHYLIRTQTSVTFCKPLPRAIFPLQKYARFSLLQETTPEHKLTFPAGAPASPHGTHSGSPGMSGCLLSPRTLPAAVLEPAPHACLHGWDALCVSQPRSFPNAPLNVL